VKARIRTVLPLIILIAATIGCDRVTKHVAATALSGAPVRSFLGNTVRFEYAENPGAFLGLGANWPSALRTGVFVVANAALLLLLAGVAVKRTRSRLSLVGMALLFAGGASNLVDRAVRGSVIDFMNVGLGPLRTGIFNVADVAIMVGVALVLLSSSRSREHRTLVY
jgi:signal peptidase II